MGKFGCTCGHVISDTTYPNEVTGDLLSCKNFELLSNYIEEVVSDFLNLQQQGRLDHWRSKYLNGPCSATIADFELISDVLTSKYSDLCLGVLECDECGRLWIQEEIGVNRYRAYSPNYDGPAPLKVLGLNRAPE